MSLPRTLLGRQLRLLREILGEGLVEDPSELAQRLDIILVDLAAAVGRQIQIQAGAASDGLVIDVEQLLRCLHLVVLGRMVEPAGPNRDIAFRGHPIGAGPLALIQIRLGVARHSVPDIDGGPAWLAGDAAVRCRPSGSRARRR